MKLYCKPCQSEQIFQVIGRWWCCSKCGDNKITYSDYTRGFEQAFATNQPRQTPWLGREGASK